MNSLHAGGTAADVLPIPAVQPGPQQTQFDRLATAEGRSTLAPTLVLETRPGGKLWLAGIPTAATMDRFPPVNLQICCMSQYPEGRGGVTLPNASLMKFDIGRPSQSQDWKLLWPLIHQSLQCGDSVLIHCMAGKHRAPALTSLVYALMLGGNAGCERT